MILWKKKNKNLMMVNDGYIDNDDRFFCMFVFVFDTTKNYNENFWCVHIGAIAIVKVKSE